jgi:alkylhydroperoxidase/carboxymuconolactone decarboxylase family protein YurZ
MMDKDLIDRSQAYVDRLIGEGAGLRHIAFLDRIQPEALREALHRCHLMEDEDTHLSVEENYLIGVAVLCATRCYAPASMFAKTLRHRGVPATKILEVIGRLAMWIGPVPAAEAAGHIQRALREYEDRGAASMDAWFPGARP